MVEAQLKLIRTDMKLLEVTMIYAGKDGTKEELLVLRAHQELWEWNVAAPLSRWFWYVLILSGSDGLSGIATPSVIELAYIAVRTSTFIFTYIYFNILVTNSIPHTLGITRMTKKRKGPSAYTGIVCIWCLYISVYILDMIGLCFFSLCLSCTFVIICVCVFFLFAFSSVAFGTGHDFTLCTISTFSLMGCFLAWCLQHFNGEGRWRAQYVCPVFTQRTLRLTSSARRYVSRWGLALWSHGKNVKVLGTDRLVLRP